MTLATSSQRSQIIRSKFRSVLQLRIHRRYQDPSLSRSFTASPVLDPDPWVSATDPTLAPGAPAPVSPKGPTPFLFNPGDLLLESEYSPWRSLKESPKISQHWREPKPKGNLTYHQYMPPGRRQGSRVNPQAKGLALGPLGPPLWEGTKSQQPPPRTTARMKPTALTPSPPGVPSPLPPPHKLELQTLKLEELTVSELRQQLRLRGLPVSGTKSMLLERMRSGALPRQRPKPRREDGPACAPWPRLRPKALGAVRRQGSLKPSANSHAQPPARAPETPATAAGPTAAPAPASTPASAPAPAPAPLRAAAAAAAAAAAPAPTPPAALPTAALTLEEELQEAIRRAQVSGSGPGLGQDGAGSRAHAASAHPQLLPNRGIDDILEDQVEPEDPLPPIPLDFPGSFDVLSFSPDSEGLSSVFSSSLPSPTNSPSPSPRGPTDSLDWLEALSGGPLLGCGSPAPSIFSADLSDSSGTRLWDLLADSW
ncbi:MEF2-activating motif and SAP domain-containing transcriptional regulator isoform X3 [Mustela putorius furo]|uniref:MEF2-activating motif and SAP domain-containing transcriptional regulator n=1 Tax=Mustela putorius furo TaxID=9669 RepID=A0A8U0RXZ2_MUSPF|nr:MEF2-activating motif and SAP domain-containing transcriptional regulator isoform X3 [Mustela putorius furo]XP_044933006.1 MEF2-activating motif and SAP domain-containing transcriptional regulator isoform X3 [Mustela putorius furo]